MFPWQVFELTYFGCVSPGSARSGAYHFQSVLLRKRQSDTTRPV